MKVSDETDKDTFILKNGSDETDKTTFNLNEGIRWNWQRHFYSYKSVRFILMDRLLIYKRCKMKWFKTKKTGFKPVFFIAQVQFLKLQP